DGGRGDADHQQGDREGALAPAGEDPLLGAGRGRDQGRRRGLQEEARRASGRASERGEGYDDLMTAPAQNAAPTAPTPPRPALKAFGVADGAAARIKVLLAQRNTPGAGLRVAVRGGGCSGLAYVIEWAEAPKERDKIFEKDGIRVFVDPKS